MNELPRSVHLVGAGKMGGALLRGWLRAGLAGDRVTVFDPHPSEDLLALARDHGFGLRATVSGDEQPDVVVLAVKPQMLDAAAPPYAGTSLEDTVLVSIVAGKTVADLSARFRARAIVRAMPNTPAAVGRGITGAFANPTVTPAQRAMTDALLGCVGVVEWLPREDLVDAVTAVSGSGPAYVFFLAECLADAARAVGLEAAMADRFARATVEGAGALMMAEPTVGADQLRRNVTSPGGTTAAALDVLGRGQALRILLEEAVVAARDRAARLSG